jgi:hypothetical protein
MSEAGACHSQCYENLKSYIYVLCEASNSTDFCYVKDDTPNLKILCCHIYVIFNLYEMFHTIFVGTFMIIFVPDFT